MRLFKEDYSFTSTVIDELCKIHKLDKSRTVTLMHIYVHGLECDVVLKSVNARGRRVTVGIELKNKKSYDCSKVTEVLQQCLERRKYFTYMYALINNCNIHEFIVCLIKNDRTRYELMKCIDVGVGVILKEREKVLVVLKSRKLRLPTWY